MRWTASPGGQAKPILALRSRLPSSLTRPWVQQSLPQLTCLTLTFDLVPLTCEKVGRPPVSLAMPPAAAGDPARAGAVKAARASAAAPASIGTRDIETSSSE